MTIQFAGRERARPHQCHSAGYHMEKLRDLVNRVTAAKSRESAAHSRIVKRLDSLTRLVTAVIAPHRSKLKHVEWFAKTPDPCVSNNRRSASKHNNDCPNHNEERQQ
jgi:hypothetical protein